MAYTPTDWRCGDVVTAEALNKMEQGIANAGGGQEPLIFTITEREATLEECPLGMGGTVIEYSHSWQEIHDALINGRMCFYKKLTEEEVGLFPMIVATINEGVYVVVVASDGYLDPPFIMFNDVNTKTTVTCADR